MCVYAFGYETLLSKSQVRFVSMRNKSPFVQLSSQWIQYDTLFQLKCKKHQKINPLVNSFCPDFMTHNTERAPPAMN